MHFSLDGRKESFSWGADVRRIHGLNQNYTLKQRFRGAKTSRWLIKIIYNYCSPIVATESCCATWHVFLLSESSPIKVPERSFEDKCVQKNVLSSPSHTPLSALQSSSDSSQPSWMELAKRKSMAWSDKSMDWEEQMFFWTIYVRCWFNSVMAAVSLF